MATDRKRWTDDEVVQLRAAFDEQVARAEKAEAELDAQLEKVADMEADLRELTGIRQTAVEMANGMEFYRDIVRQCGEVFGVAAYTSDDGSVQDSVLALKVPELTREMFLKLAHLEDAQREQGNRCRGVPVWSDGRGSTFTNYIAHCLTTPPPSVHTSTAMITSDLLSGYVREEWWQRQYIVTSRQIIEGYYRLLCADNDLVTAVAPKRGQLTLPLEPKS